MAGRQDYPVEVFSVYNRLRSQPDLNQTDIGFRMKDMYPEIFGSMKPKSICKAIIEAAQEREDVELTYGTTGSRPRMLPENDSRWRDENPVLVVPYSPKVIVGSDLHFPLHDPIYLSRFIQTIKAKKIETVVLNGDLFDNGHIGHKGRTNVWNPTYHDAVDAFRYFWVELLDCESLKNVYAICGNHDDKPFRDSDRVLEFTERFEKAINGIEAPRHINVQVTNRYYLYMEPKAPKSWPFDGPDNFPLNFTHQSEYSRIPGSVENRLTHVELTNTYSGHHHHLSVSRHPSDMFWLVGCGTGQQVDLAPYKNGRQSTHPKWNVGFITIDHNVPRPWAIYNSDEWWEEQLCC